jgi:hypothetical protein
MAVHKLEPNFNHFVALANYPLPIPLDDNFKIEDVADSDNSAFARHLKRTEEDEKEQVSEMQTRAENAVEKSRQARRQQQRMQKKLVQKREKQPIQVTQEQATAEGRTGPRPPLRVEVNKADGAWELFGLTKEEILTLKADFQSELGRRLLRLKDGVLGCTLEPGKAMASWVESIRGLQGGTVKIYLNRHDEVPSGVIGKGEKANRHG